MLVDRDVQRSDQQVTNLQDMNEVTRTSQPPLSIPRNITQMIHWFSETVEGALIITSTTLPVYGAYNFQLGNLNNSTSLQGLFDEYSIVGVAAKLTCCTPSVSGDQGLFLTAIDHDDSNVPTSLATVQQYSSCIETRGGLGHTRVVYPRIATAAYATGLFNGFSNQRAWVDIASPAVEHYGIKWAHSVTTAPITYRAVFTYYYCCRTNR